MTLRPVLERAVARPRTLAALGAAAAVLVALTATDLAGAASRAALVVVAIAFAAASLRSRPRAAAIQPIAIAARRQLTRDAGVAVLEVDGRRLLVGFGADGVRVLSRLGSGREGGDP